MKDSTFKPCQELLLNSKPIRRQIFYNGSLELYYYFDCADYDEGVYLVIHLDEDKENTSCHRNLLMTNIAKICTSRCRTIKALDT